VRRGSGRERVRRFGRHREIDEMASGLHPATVPPNNLRWRTNRKIGLLLRRQLPCPRPCTARAAAGVTLTYRSDGYRTGAWSCPYDDCRHVQKIDLAGPIVSVNRRAGAVS
jgi:hypothetical protein